MGKEVGVTWCHYCNWRATDRPGGLCPKCNTESPFEVMKDGYCQSCNEKEAEPNWYYCEECWAKRMPPPRKDVKKELIEAIRNKGSDPKLIWLWTNNKGSWAIEKLVLKEETLILIQGKGYRDCELIEISTPIELSILDVIDFAVRYERIGRLCEDDAGWFRFERKPPKG